MCDTLAIVEPGRVLWAKNSDRDANEAQALDWRPRQTHAPGSRVRCTWIEIPQAPVTFAVLLSRPFWMWGAEMGTNEFGVTIGNEAVFTRQPLAATGLTGMDLLRLALERADTAELAVSTIVRLLEEFGQGGRCGLEHAKFSYHNSFIVADPRQAFVLETAGGLHAVEGIRGARSISNGLTIPGFAGRHTDFVKTRVSACRLRQARTQELAGRAQGPGHLMQALRDHGAGRTAPQYSWLNGGMDAPCMHAGGVLAASQTTASWVAELTPQGCRHWVTATAAPCTSLFKPVRVDRPLDLGPWPGDTCDDRTLWWRHERLHRLALTDPASLLPWLSAERDATEAHWLANPPDPAEAFAHGDQLLANWTAAVLRHMAAHPARDVRPLAVRRYWHKRNRWAGMDEAAPAAHRPAVPVALAQERARA